MSTSEEDLPSRDPSAPPLSTGERGREMPEMGTISLGTAAAMRRLLDGEGDDEGDSDGSDGDSDGSDNGAQEASPSGAAPGDSSHSGDVIDAGDPADDVDSEPAPDPPTLSEIKLVEPNTKRVVAAIGLFMFALVVVIVLLLIL